LLQAVATPRERESLLARLSSEWLQVFALVDATPAPPPNPAPASKVPPTRSEQQQQALGEKEFKARQSNVDALRGEIGKLALPRVAPAASVRFARLEPLWLGSELVLARRVLVGERLLVQACWLDWPGLRASLLASIHDLLPSARLEPAGDGDDPARRLAALPVKLVPGPALAAPAPSFEGERLPMGVAWGLAVLALAASGALLLGLTTLGERRAAFTSAVTHELRTPLTTFRMYADMLAEGMVPRGREREYLDTLRREAERQAHLVENVLAYSRLERGRYTAARETLPLGELIAGLRETLRAQAERAGMTLVAPDAGEWEAAEVVADRSAVERVLFNLVDNAGKYARVAADRRVHLECRVEPRAIVLSVRDHGPGVSPREARRLFRPFHKSARDAAQSAPGVGLGLALSRRLARAIGGDLRLESTPGEGATFALRLPRD
jgi:signal transduction histidine kinase